MASTGRGKHVLAPRYVPWDWLLRPDLTRSTAGYRIAVDWFWGNPPASPTPIPYTWLRPPVRFRPDSPINTTAITRKGGATARAVNAVSRDEFTEHSYTATLDTATSGDPAALAAFLVDVYAVDPPRQRVPDLTLILNSRTTSERQLILEQEIGNRIQVTGTPATWPQGTTSLVILGIRHQIAVDLRTVTWDTTPVVGDDPGDPGPWFRADDSFADGTDDAPF